MEYDVDKVVFDEHSTFQHVQILHSNTFGNMLVLDDLQSKSLVQKVWINQEGSNA
jgi:spermidine synthase